MIHRLAPEERREIRARRRAWKMRSMSAITAPMNERQHDDADRQLAHLRPVRPRDLLHLRDHVVIEGDDALSTAFGPGNDFGRPRLLRFLVDD